MKREQNTGFTPLYTGSEALCKRLMLPGSMSIFGIYLVFFFLLFADLDIKDEVFAKLGFLIIERKNN